MASYDVISEFGLGDATADEAIATDPHLVVAVYRFANPTTYSRSQKSSFSTLFEDAVKLQGPALILADNCVALSCSSSKNSHITQMSATLVPSQGHNFLAEILPGDWAFAWMMHSRAAQQDVIAKLKRGDSANGFASGLKFMGRVNSLRKVINQEGSIGTRTTRYSLTCAGFTEFDSTLFYEPHLAEKIPAIGQYWARIGGKVNTFIEKNGQGIGVTDAMLFFLDLLLGRGVPRNLGRGNDDPRLRATTGPEAPYSYVVPLAVGSVIGKTETTKTGGLLASADMLEVVYGIQQYAEEGVTADELQLLNSDAKDKALDIRAGQIFSPRGTRGGGSRRWTGTDLMGSFIPSPPQFTDKSVWTVLNQYLNPAVNEIFTCLRVNPSGLVVPTLTIRQLPFSTELGPTNIEITKYLSLPRWKIHPIMVKRADIGRSEALRTNFIHVGGDPGPIKADLYARQIIVNPPRRDDLDVARSGLKPYQMTVNCAISDIRNGEPSKWMDLLADILMGQQLTLTGLIEMHGVQAPICPGDNLEWDGTVFHIESVTHNCQISPQGLKDFSTTVAVTHGLAATPLASDLGIYSGVGQNDQRSQEAGLTQDGEDLNEPEGQLFIPEDPSGGVAL